MIDLALEHDLEQFFLQPFGNEDPDMQLAVLQNPHTIVATSDTGAHVSQITDASIPTHLLAYWVRERQAMTMERAPKERDAYLQNLRNDAYVNIAKDYQDSVLPLLKITAAPQAASEGAKPASKKKS